MFEVLKIASLVSHDALRPHCMPDYNRYSSGSWLILLLAELFRGCSTRSFTSSSHRATRNLIRCSFSRWDYDFLGCIGLKVPRRALAAFRNPAKGGPKGTQSDSGRRQRSNFGAAAVRFSNRSEYFHRAPGNCFRSCLRIYWLASGSLFGQPHLFAKRLRADIPTNNFEFRT